MQQPASVQPRPMRPGKSDASRVIVEATPNGERWTIVMHEEGSPTDRLDFSKDARGMRKHDWHEIDFVLEEPSGRLAFHPDKWEAIWVARGTEQQAPGCPDAKCRDHDVYPLSLEDKLLRVCNRNGDRCLLSFRLNFVAAGSCDRRIIAFLDPIMGNGNGGRD